MDEEELFYQESESEPVTETEELEFEDEIIEEPEEVIELAPEPPTIYTVYARGNEDGKVTKIFSNCLESPLDTDTVIKSGSGDEYVHVGYYQIYTEDAAHKYKIADGVMTECTAEEIAAEIAERPEPEPSEAERIAILEASDIQNTETQADLMYAVACLQLGI